MCSQVRSELSPISLKNMTKINSSRGGDEETTISDRENEFMDLVEFNVPISQSKSKSYSLFIFFILYHFLSLKLFIISSQKL